MINGKIDQMLYEWKRLYQDVPFDELKQASCINDKANAADKATFHSEIRHGLPGFDQTTTFESKPTPAD